MNAHLHPDSATIGGTTDPESNNRYYHHHHHQQQQQQQQQPDHHRTSPDELDRIIADARSRGEARAASKYPSTSTSDKRASSPCPSARSTDSARRRREVEDGYNPIQYAYEKRGGFKEWWRRQRLDGPHGAAALVEAIGQGFTYALISILN